MNYLFTQTYISEKSIWCKHCGCLVSGFKTVGIVGPGLKTGVSWFLQFQQTKEPST